jgi:hypothetical protein
LEQQNGDNAGVHVVTLLVGEQSLEGHDHRQGN